jgi:hypothetical protein
MLDHAVLPRLDEIVLAITRFMRESPGYLPSQLTLLNLPLKLVGICTTLPSV